MKYRPVPFYKRLAAFFIDYFTFLAVGGIFGFLLGFGLAKVGMDAETRRSAIAFVQVAMMPVTLFLAGWFNKEYGGTPGKLALGIRVIHLPTGNRVGYWRTVLRETIGRYADILPLFAGIVCGFVRADKRFFHDLVSQTLVVEAADLERPAPEIRRAA